MAVQRKQTTRKREPAAASGRNNNDRLSALPDDLLRRILIAADLDTATAVRTILFSTRWRSLWRSCLPSLRFRFPSSHHDEGKSARRYRVLVENVLSLRDSSQLALLSLAADNHLSHKWAEVLDRIYAYGLAHHVPTFHLTAQTTTTTTRPVRALSLISTRLASLCASVQTLSLSFLRFDLHGLVAKSWNLPSLTSLSLRRCVIRQPDCFGARHAPFEMIPNLGKLELADCEFEAAAVVTVSGEKLSEIDIVFSDDAAAQRQPPWIEVSAPRCRKVTCRGVHLDRWLSVELPSLECLDVDGRVSSRSSEERRLRFVRIFEKFGNAELVRLHPNSFEALTQDLGLLEKQPPRAFKRIKCLELDTSWYNVEPRRTEFNSLIKYMFDDYIGGPTVVLDQRTNYIFVTRYQ